MPPPALSGSPLPPWSPLEISSRRPCSSVFEQGGPFEKVPVVDLSSSSDEKCLIPGISLEEEFAKKLFGDLNRDVLGHPVTARSSSSSTLMKKKRRVRRMPPTPKPHLLLLQGPRPQSLTPMKLSRGCKTIIVMILPRSRDGRWRQRWRQGRVALGCRAKVAPVRRHASRRTSRALHCYSISSFVERSGDGDAESLKYFDALHASCSFSISVCP
jgi:hypothetical protein